MIRGVTTNMQVGLVDLLVDGTNIHVELCSTMYVVLNLI